MVSLLIVKIPDALPNNHKLYIDHACSKQLNGKGNYTIDKYLESQNKQQPICKRVWLSNIGSVDMYQENS